MEGEPNDWQRHQRCLTYLKDQVEIYKCSDRSSVEGKLGKYNREPDRHDHRSTWSWGSCASFKHKIVSQDIFGYGTYHWNDWDCAETARYICEAAPIPTNATVLRLH